ncbi:hypothetical protein I5907_09820 [Panacibacter sp. DH6]|uniref:Uncharacterized protein n=1 Tax=Panacibacter microcysteis TaxID=2793269 RepID=A0A931EA57_9BACT|nr:hypothetical protein [Panacibacter microcysteis]MBG9376531.1 hypothetical protein [Panacibacter microcysteis]
MRQDNLAGQTIYNTDFIIDGIPRNCLFYIPQHHNKEVNQYRLLIVLHDSGSTSKNVVSRYGDVLHAQSDSLQAVVLYPDAAGKTWSTGNAPGSVNDAGFISIIADYFVQRYGCNAKELFVAGLGQGGAMARKLGCDLPSKLAGIADLSASLQPYTCTVPLLPPDQVQLLQNGRPDTTAFLKMWQFFSK